jgi:hypothetical protein
MSPRNYVTRVCLFLFILLAFATPSTVPSAVARPETGQIWFDDLEQPRLSTPAEQAALVGYIVEAIARRTGNAPAFPADLQDDTSPQIVFLSVSDGTHRAHVTHGAGTTMQHAVQQALARMYPLLAEHANPAWIKVDIVQTVVAQSRRAVRHPLGWERSLYGLAFDASSGLTFLPGELVAATLVDSDQMLRPYNITKYLRDRPPQAAAYARLINADSVDLYRYTTLSLFWDSEQEAVIPLYRGHRMFEQVTADDLLAAAAQGGAYLTRSVRADGSFVYEYLPKTDRVPDDYNILRHAGTIYSMLELYAHTGDPLLLAAAERAITYLVQQVRPCTTPTGTRPCVVEDGVTKLGGNGLAVVALAKYTQVTGHRHYLPLMRGLGHWIQSMQNEQGEFTRHKQTYPEGHDTGFVSQYYPGEALLALNRLYALDPDPAWLDSAEAGTRYLITVRDAGLADAELPHDHWLLYALNDLYRQRPDPLYLQHAMRIAGTIVASQNRQPAYPDWRGSFYHPPRSTPTATRMEGVCAAYKLARDSGQTAELANMREALRLGTAFQLQTQFRPESALYVHDPQRTLGGFKHSLTNYTIRNDYVQHNISSLLCVREVMLAAN